MSCSSSGALLLRQCRFLLPVLFLLLTLPAKAQEIPSLQYYLPDISYDQAVPTPAQYLGYEVGKWHVTHDQLVGYMRTLAAASDRISIEEYGRTHEDRPMLCLTITAPGNHRRLDDIRSRRRILADPARSGKLDPADFPAVAYMGYSIHGNEASGSNAALIVAYYLAAGRSPEVEQLLKNTVILLDPCFNPDGLQRFAGWVNSRRSQALMPDPAHDEFNEPWPGGRTNHYWFDLNRDWLVAQQPESVGRVRIFQDWLPNVLTDHHEMGTNSTFFFQPGVPSRVHPITPARNQELTAKIGEYHARFLSEKKVLFFSGENYDDFYYGKGSTYPDGTGCVGILFEQASSRGSAQETANGLLTFPYTIRNHVLSSLSTLTALGDLRVELNTYLREFYQSALTEAGKDPARGYVFGDSLNGRPVHGFLELLLRHRIQVAPLVRDVQTGGRTFRKGQAWVVPAEQPNYRLVKAIFERRTDFADSIFYDISAWTLPDAFGLNWTAVDRRTYQQDWAGQPLSQVPALEVPVIPVPGPKAYAYVVDSRGYDLPRLLEALHRAKVRVQVATQPFRTSGLDFAAGSLVIPLERQALDGAAIQACLLNSGARDVQVHLVSNGLTPGGPDLGSNNFVTLRPPKVVLVTGNGGANSVGEVWHLLDTRYGLTPLLVEAERFGRLDISKYNVVILADGNFNELSQERLREFVAGGGTLVATGASLRWLRNAGLMGLRLRNQPASGEPGRRPYGTLDEDRSARRLSGAIFELELDLTHPLCYGYTRSRLAMFQRDTIFIETARNPYATPAVFTDSPLLSGYLHPDQSGLAPGAAAIVVGGTGSGRIICFSGNPNFRAFWYGTNRLFANALFFGNLISGSAIERR
ncbi:MAG: zinc carboxypeptidase [Bacteroidetes bacterium]|nr:MAG: zinc carboxypeptidase [Bacteroidota bacterium]